LFAIKIFLIFLKIRKFNEFYIFPPKSLALKVTTAAPKTIVRKTAKNKVAPSDFVAMLIVSDKVMHRKIGPHKSPKIHKLLLFFLEVIINNIVLISLSFHPL